MVLCILPLGGKTRLLGARPSNPARDHRAAAARPLEPEIMR